MEPPAARHAEATSGLWLTPPSASPAEDRYGNCFEEMPKAVVSGQWQWPLTPLAGASEPKDGRGLEASRQSHQAQVQHRLWEAHPNPNPNPNFNPILNPNPDPNPNPDQVQHRLWEAVCKEELGPLVDEALQDLAQQRTPGTYLYDCTETAAGRPTEHVSSRFSAEDLRRINAELKEQMSALQVGADRAGTLQAPHAAPPARPKHRRCTPPAKRCACSPCACAGGARQGGGREEDRHQDHRDLGD